jgi:hypothetical protein
MRIIVAKLTANADGRAQRKNAVYPPEWTFGMSVTRIAWMATVFIALLTALLLLLAGYIGYAGLSVAVGASAAINLL